MPILVALALQQTAAPDGALTVPPALTTVRRCPADAGGDEVTVCGRPDPDRYRLKPLPPRFVEREGLPPAETRLGGGTLSATGEKGAVGGIPINRAMVKWRLAF